MVLLLWIAIVFVFVSVVVRLTRQRTNEKNHEPHWPPIHDRIVVRDVSYQFVRALSEDECPYCGTTIEPRPRRARKCPYCQKRVERATVEGDRKVLLTVSEFKSYSSAISNEFCRRMRANHLASFEFDRTRAVNCGSRGYVWRTTSDDDCIICKENNGKFFSWNANLTHGHAGLCDICPEGYCRCDREIQL